MANTKIRATAELFLNTKNAQNDAKVFINDLKQKLHDIETAADKMTVFKDMVSYIAQVDRALAALKANNKDAFAHMFDGLDANLKAQLEGIFGIDGAKLGKLDVLREQLGNLTLKTSIKEIKAFAKEINTLFTSIGMDVPFENIDEIFRGRTSSEHLKKLGVELANFATVWEDVNSRVSKGFGGPGGGNLDTAKLEQEIKGLESRLAKYRKVQEELQNISAARESFLQDEWLDESISIEYTIDSIKQLAKEFQDAKIAKEKFESAGDTSSLEYYQALAKYSKAVLQANDIWTNAIDGNKSFAKELKGTQFGSSNLYNIINDIIDPDIDTVFDNLTGNIGNVINQLESKITQAVGKLQSINNNTGESAFNNIGNAANETGEKVDMLGKKLLSVSEYVSALSGQLKEMFAAAGRSANFEYHIAIDGLDIKARHGSEKSVDLATQTQTYLDTLFSDSVLYGHSHRGGTSATNIYDIESVLSSYRDGVAIPVHFVVGKDSITTMDFTGVSKDMADQLMREIAATNSNKNAPVINENINKIVEKFTGKSGALKTWNVEQFDDLARYIYDISSAASSALTPIEKFQAVLDNMFGKGKVDATKYESLLSGLNQDNVKNIFNQIASMEKLPPIKTTDMLTMGQVNAEIDESIAKYKALREEANLSYSDIRNEVDKVIKHYSSGGGTSSGLDFFQKYFPEGEWQNVRNLLTDAYDNLISLEEVTNRIAGEFGIDPEMFAQIPNVAQTSQIDQAKAKLESFMALTDEIRTKNFNEAFNATDNIEIGKYTERIEVAINELQELGQQGLLTADQLESVSAAYKSAMSYLDGQKHTYDGYGDGYGWGDADSSDVQAAEDAARDAQARAEEAESESLRYQEAANRLLDEKAELQRENDNLKEQTKMNAKPVTDASKNVHQENTEAILKEAAAQEQLNQAQKEYHGIQSKESVDQISTQDNVKQASIDMFEDSNGQLALFDGVSSSAQRATGNVEELETAVKMVDDIDGQMSLFDNISSDAQKASGNVEELEAAIKKISSIDDKKAKLSDIETEIEARTARHGELAKAYSSVERSILRTTHGIASKDIPDLDLLQEAYDSVVDEGGKIKPNSMIWARELYTRNKDNKVGQALFQMMRFPEKYGGEQVGHEISPFTDSRDGRPLRVPLSDEKSVYLASNAGFGRYNAFLDPAIRVYDPKDIVPRSPEEIKEQELTGGGNTRVPLNNLRNVESYLRMSQSEALQNPVIQQAYADAVKQMDADKKIAALLGQNTPEMIERLRPLMDESSSVWQEGVENRRELERLTKEKSILEQEIRDAEQETSSNQQTHQDNTDAIVRETAAQEQLNQAKKEGQDIQQQMVDTVQEEIKSEDVQTQETYQDNTDKIISEADAQEQLNQAKLEGQDIQEQAVTIQQQAIEDVEPVSENTHQENVDAIIRETEAQEQLNQAKKEEQNIQEQTATVQEDVAPDVTPDAMYEGANGQLAFFENISEGAKQASDSVEQLDVAMKAVENLDGQMNLFDNVSQEQNVNNELKEQLELEEQISSADKPKDTSDLQVIQQENEALKEQKKIIDQINDSTGETKGAKKDKESAKKSTKFGHTALVNATAKYNNLSMTAGSSQFAGSAVVQDALKQYKESYQEVVRLQNELSTKKNRTLADEAGFKEATNECNKYARALEKVLENSLKLHNTKANKHDYILGTDFDYFDPDSRQAALSDFAQQMYGVNLATTDFKDDYNKAVFAVDNGNGTFTQMTATFTDARNEIVAMAGDTKKMQTALGSFIDGFKGRVKSLAQYFLATVSIYDVWRVIKQGVTSVKEIDSALTELKKVTDETDASYANFLQNMSKTGATIGATVKDLTTMASEWARLGSIIESAPLYSNI